MASENHIYKMSNAGGFKSLTRYYDMLAGNTVWNPWSPTGAYDALATVTVPSGGAASVTFSGIPTGYKHLQIRSLSHASSGSQPAMLLRLNSDSGASYAWHGLEGNGSSAYAYAMGAANTASYIYSVAGTAFNASTFSGHVIDLLDYSSLSKNKTIRSLGGNDNNGNGYISFNSGLWMNSSTAVTSLTFTIDGGASFTQYSQFALYGIK